MGRGAVIAVWVLCAAVVGASGVGRAQVPVTPLRPAEPLPPVPTFGQPDDTSIRTSLQPGKDDEPVAPVPPIRPELVLPDGSGVVMPEGAKQTIRFGPRYGKLNDYTVDKQPDGAQRLTYSGGLKVNVVTLPDPPQAAAGAKPQEMEFAADNVVVWVRGLKNTTDLLSGGVDVDRAPKKEADGDKDKPAEKDEKVRIELYMSGNVVIRTLGGPAPGAPPGSPPAQQILRAEEIYYDVDRNRAISLDADLETKFPLDRDSVHLRGREIWRLGQQEWRGLDTTLFSSKRPADPALTVTSREATLLEQETVKRNIFGWSFRDSRTGEVDVSNERILTAYRNRVRVMGVPLFALPRYRADLADPAGPLANFGFRQDTNVFGTQFYTSWDVYKLLALRPPPDRTWRLNVDYLSLRGPAAGADYGYSNAFFGPNYRNNGSATAYFVYDRGADLLGGFRGVEPRSSDPNTRSRGRFNWNHSQDIYEDGTTYVRAMGQFAFLSDKNFYEQYFKFRSDLDPNQETFAYVYGASGNLAFSALAQANVNRPWVTETNWLPRGDAGLIGQSFFDLFVYSSRATAGYAQFKPASQESVSTLPAEARAVNTGLFDWNQRIGLPVDAGPVRVEPYALMDLTYYTRNTNGDGQGRFYGGGGVSASVPLSRVYADATSELFNLRGLNHKVNAGVNWFAGYSSADRSLFPQLNRLNDDTMDLTYRSARPWASLYTPGAAGLALQNSPMFDPQSVAVRRLVDSRPETLDTLQVVQFALRQRLQTKRGLPGADHTVDWMSLDLSASLFPDAARDNFGQSWGFLEYNYLWNLGDRTAISSSGWYQPGENAPKYFNIGAFYSRPDGSNLYLGYRYTDPVNSRVFITSLGYQLSTKYSLNLTNVFDFGTNLSQGTSVTFNRTGTDVTMSFGFSFSALVPGNNVGFQFLIIPNAAIAASGAGARTISPLTQTGGR